MFVLIGVFALINLLLWTQPAAAIPVAFVAVALAVAETSAIAIVATAVVNIALSVALSFVAQALFKPPSRGGTGQGSTQVYTDNKVTVRQPAASAQLVYGLARVPGVIAYAKTTGGNKYLHLVILLAGHECNAFHTVTVNEEWFAVGSLDGNGFITSGQYAGKVRFKFHLGSPTQTADSDLVSESGGDWTTADRLKGICYMYVRLEWDSKVFIGGIPNLTALVYGKNDIYDPRDASTGYQYNSALCVANYLCDSTFGVGVDINTGIDLTALSAAANSCDESVSKIGGGTEQRYVTSGVTITSNQPQEILGQLLGSMHGRAPYNGSQWRILAGVYQSPTLSFTDDDLRAGPKVQSLTSRRDLFNAVKGTYFEPLSLFNEVDFPPVVNATYASQDGQTIYKDIQLPFTTSNSQCQRIAKIEIERTRTGMITATMPCKLSAWRCQAGDTISWTSARYGWSSKPFEVTRAQFVVDPQTGILGVDLTLIATASSVYSWSSSEEGTISAGSTTSLPDPLNVVAPTSLVLTEVAQITAPGTGVKSDIAVSWTASTDAFVSEYQVEYKKSTDSTYTVSGRTTGVAFVVRDREPATWNIRVAAVNVKGILSSYLSGSLATTGDLTAPSDPSGLSVTYSFTVGGASSVFLQWTPSAQEKVYSGGKVEIRFQAVTSGATWASATLVTTVPGREMTAVVPFSQSGTYLIKFLSAAGTYSTNAASVVATYSAAYQPMKIVGALPGSGEFTGQVVYLTTDGKLYRWNGSAWTASVPTTDLTGLITGGLMGPNSVTANNLTVGDFQNRVDNPDFNLGNVSWGTYSGVTFTGTTPTHYAITTASGYNGSADYLLVDIGATNATPCANANLFPVQAGEVYYFAAAVAVQQVLGNGPSQSCIVRLHFLDSSGANVAGTNNTLTWASVDYSSGNYTVKAPAATTDVTVPANAINAYVEVLTGSATPLAVATYRVGWIFCSKKNNGNVIVDGSITANLVAANAIVTNSLVAGAVTAAKASITQLSALTVDAGSINAGTFTGVTFQTASSGLRIVMDGSHTVLRAIDPSYASRTYYAPAYADPDIVAQFGADASTGYTRVIDYEGNIGGDFISLGNDGTPDSTPNSVGTHGTGAFSGVAGVGTKNGVIAAGGTWDFYAFGAGSNYGPFTGSHDALVAKATATTEGDIVVDVEMIAHKSVSNAICRVEPSSSASQSGVIGIVVSRAAMLATGAPVALCDDPVPGEYPTIAAAYAGLVDTLDRLSVNGLGEGLINVCGQGGDVAIGDLIVTSDTAGKGMKQADGIVRNTTVAKAREAVTFSGPTDVKQIACIYLCG